MSSENEKVADVEKTEHSSFAPDLAHNVNAKLVLSPLQALRSIDRPRRIQNPLHGLSKEQLYSQVDDFCREKGMDDKIDLLRKGALVAQHPSKFEELAELDETEKQIFRDEILRKA